MIVRGKADPYIICIYSLDAEQKRFYMHVNDHLIPLSVQMGFIQIIDLYFKLHKILGIPFDKSVFQTMAFIDCFIFHMDNTRDKITVKSQNFARSCFTQWCALCIINNIIYASLL